MNTAWTAASEEIYKATQASGGPTDGQESAQNTGSSNQAGGSENVTDAEFEEVK